MNIWNCKAPVAALALSTLAGCEGGFDTSFLDGFSLKQKDAALSQAKMAFGAVTLVAPSGFCIDKRSLQQQFAMMARCDTLGVPSAASGAPLGVITASFTPTLPGSALPTPVQTAAALGLTAIIDPFADQTQVTFRATGAEALPGASADHWRATARVGDQTIALALHGPAESLALDSEGRDILIAVITAAKTTP